MSQITEFDARVRSELQTERSGSLGWCAACGARVLLEDDFMRVEGRVTHVDCRRRVARAEPDRSHARQPIARPPRVRIALSCTLRRRAGSPIAADTLELGPDGMLVIARRPLADDEILDFDLPNLKTRVGGRARVLRQQRPHVYVLRFERLPEAMYRCLHALAQIGSSPGS
jgi:hypothetical protein